MRRMGYFAAVAVSWIGGAAFAEFSQSQLAALTVLSPVGAGTIGSNECAGSCRMYDLSGQGGGSVSHRCFCWHGTQPGHN